MSDLRTSLRKLAEPSLPPPHAREDVLVAVGRRRRRRAALVSVAASLAVVVVAGGSVALFRGRHNDGGPVQDHHQWTRMAPSPLSPRNGTVGVWTGGRFVVVGGTSQRPCPPGADCSGPKASELLKDGASYDPDRDQWRRIAPAPQTMYEATATWTGSLMVVTVPTYPGPYGTSVVQKAATLAYDPNTDTWRTFDPAPTQFFDPGVVTPFGVAFTSGEQLARPRDWLLDLTDGSWSMLPQNPWIQASERSLVWTGHDLYVFARPDGISSAHYQFARLSPDHARWESLPDTPVRPFDWHWSWFEGHLVNPTQEASADNMDLKGTSGAYDPKTKVWSAVPQATKDWHEYFASCDLPYNGPAGTWLVAGGSALVSLSHHEARLIPPCDGLPRFDVAAWTGIEFIGYGGPAADYRSNTSQGYFWIPPQP